MSAARSEPAKSTRSNLPTVLPALFRTLIWHTACERDEVSLAAVQWVVRSLWPKSIMLIISVALAAGFHSKPVI